MTYPLFQGLCLPEPNHPAHRRRHAEVEHEQQRKETQGDRPPVLTDMG